MTFNSWHEFRTKAANDPKRIVLADGEDPRVIRAAAAAKREKIALPLLVGSASKIEPLWKEFFTNEPAPVLDFKRLSDSEKRIYSDSLLSISKFKTLSASEIAERLNDPLVLASLHLKLARTDGFIGGATRTTSDTLRAAFSIIGLAPRTSTLFGFFLLENHSDKSGKTLVLLADCAVIPEPSAKQLATIGIQGAAAYEFFTGEKARVAFLSFSTAGSAEHEKVTAVREALTTAKKKAPELDCVGEWQADAALDSFTAGIKGVGTSPLAGKVNVLVVPDLNTGNIAYKLVQRLGGCRAVGPVLWGMAKPANDLSRGCSSEDVLDMMALTVIQAQAAEHAASTVSTTH